MLGKRLRIANMKAERRFKTQLADIYDETDPAWKRLPIDKAVGMFRKHNGACSCEMCRNPRRCGWTSRKNKQTIQERKAPTVGDWE